MNAEQVKNMAQQSLKALNDDRGMMPTVYASAIADLKQVLMGLLGGSLIIDNAKPAMEVPTLVPAKDEKPSASK
jgi:hypothetical protein